MDIHVYLFSASMLVLILEGIGSYFLLKRQLNKELNKLRKITDNLYDQSKFFEKIRILESKKDVAAKLQDLNSFDEIRKEQKKLDAEFRRKLKNSNDISK